jgi:hypothetical protein
MQRLPRHPAAAHVVSLILGKFDSTALRHEHQLIGKDLYQMVLHRPVELAGIIGTREFDPVRPQSHTPRSELSESGARTRFLKTKFSIEHLVRHDLKERFMRSIEQ